MSDPLTKEQILDATEQVLRRFGLDKTSVVDVARALNVSHGTLYRHYSSKAALREAVAERWLYRVSNPLAEIIQETGNPTNKILQWLTTLIGIKRTKSFEDPELFAMYNALAEESVAIITAHINELILQLSYIVEQGIEAGEIHYGEPIKMAEAIFYATARFHHPALAKEWSSPTIDEEFKLVWDIMLHGILRTKK